MANNSEANPLVAPNSEAPVAYRRSPTATGVLTDLRHDEVLTISTRLGRCCKRGVDWERAWAALSLILFGAFAGGVYGGFPLWASDPTHQTKVYFSIAVVAALVLGLLALAARLAIHKERVESVAAIKQDLDKILESYPAIAGVGENVGTSSPIS